MAALDVLPMQLDKVPKFLAAGAPWCHQPCFPVGTVIYNKESSGVPWSIWSTWEKPPRQPVVAPESPAEVPGISSRDAGPRGPLSPEALGGGTSPSGVQAAFPDPGPLGVRGPRGPPSPAPRTQAARGDGGAQVLRMLHTRSRPPGLGPRLWPPPVCCLRWFFLFPLRFHLEVTSYRLSQSDFTQHNALRAHPSGRKWQDFILPGR